MQRAALERAVVDPGAVGQVVGGCVTQHAQQGMNIARTAWLSAGLPASVAATALDAQCGSSQQATSLAYAMVRAGVVEVALACGVESMSQVPMGSAIPPNAPSPLPAGYPTEWTSQFQGAELIAAKWGLTRAELDDFGLRTQARAAAAWSAGSFDTQIVPVGAAKRDEGLRETSAQALAGLKPIVGAGDPFVGPEPGRHTAATASQISDGAAAVLVMSAAKAETLGLTPLARIVDVCLVGSDPTLALTGPIPATQHLLSRNGLHQSDIDLVEINKAFAAVVPGLADLARSYGAEDDRTPS